MECTCRRSPGRFEGEGPETVMFWEWSMVSGQDDECGDNSEGPAWYALFRGPATFDDTVGDLEVLDAVEGEGFCEACIAEARERVATIAGAILTQSSQGFIGSTLYDDTEALDAAWAECLAECATDDDTPDDPTPEPGDYAVDMSTGYVGRVEREGKGIDVGPDDDTDALIAEQMEREQFWPNVWYVSDHGNWHIHTLEA